MANHVTNVDVIIVCFHDTLYHLKKFELQCTLKSDLHVRVMMILIVETMKFIVPCRHDNEFLGESMKVL